MAIAMQIFFIIFLVSFRKPTANTIPSICFTESDNPEQGHPSASPQMCLMQLKYHNIKTGPVQQLFILFQLVL